MSGAATRRGERGGNGGPASEAPRLWISASAGSGKTYALSTRYLRLLFDGVGVESIVATTFTRAAAGEILDRVLRRLAEGVIDEAARRELADALNRPGIDAPRCRRVLQRLLKELHRVRIGTIDSLFGQVARCFSFELQFPAAWQVGDESETAPMCTEAIAELFRRTDIEAAGRMVHMLAKGDSHRGVASLAKEAVQLGYDAYRDATEGAWNAIEQYIPARRRNAPPIDAIIERIRAAIEAGDPPLDKRMVNGVEKDLEKAAAADWGALLSGGLAARVVAGELQYYGKDIPDWLVEVYRPLVEHAVAELLHLLQYQTQGYQLVLSEFARIFEELKLQQGMFSFDDISWSLGEFFGRSESGPEQLAFRLDSRAQHWLLDEFQDTSAQQWRVLRQMALAGLAHEPSSFFCVGDVKQAIYGWRGGSARIFAEMRKDEALGELQSKQLNVSWRSAPPIIEILNETFSNIDRHPMADDYPALKRWAEEFPRHETQRVELAGHAAVHVTGEASNEEDNGASTDSLVTARMVEVVDELVQQAPACRVAVLVRKNAMVAQARNVLRSAGIEASEEGGNPLSDSLAVSWVLALLQLADHPHDRAARFHLATGPLGEMVHFTDYADDDRAEQLALEVRRRLAGEGYGRAIGSWCTRLAAHVGPRDARRLEKLMLRAFQYEDQATLRPSDFCRRIKAERVADRGGAGVRVMTIHRSKGLEFDAVVLPELHRRFSPSRERLATFRPTPSGKIERVFRYPNKQTRPLLPAVLQEDCERNMVGWTDEWLALLYVAMSRAKHALHLIVPPPGKNPSQTWAGLLQAALAGEQRWEPGTTPYELGDAAWYEQVAWEPQTESPETPPIVPSAIELAATSRRRARRPRVSPSRLHGAPARAVAARAAPRQDAAVTGSVIHFWLEQIEWIESHTIDAQVAIDGARRAFPQVADDRLNEWFALLQQWLEQEPLCTWLHRSAYDEPSRIELPEDVCRHVVRWDVETERPLQMLTPQDELLTGSIDRLVLGRDAQGEVVLAQVIDYKTDRIDGPQRLRERMEHYAPQLDAYRFAVAQLYGLPTDHVHTKLLFLRTT